VVPYKNDEDLSSEKVQDCRSEEGQTIGLVDSLLYIARALAPRDMSTKYVQEALADLLEDEAFKTVLRAGVLNSVVITLRDLTAVRKDASL
jgi:hypothetical protein